MRAQMIYICTQKSRKTVLETAEMRSGAAFLRCRAAAGIRSSPKAAYNGRIQ